MAYTDRIVSPLTAILRRGAHFGAVICLALLVTLRPASADSTDDAINMAVGLLVTTGATVGINISSTEAQIVKQVIKDVVVNGRSIPDALKDAVLAPLIGDLPPEVQSAAQCLVNGTSVDKCALQQLPPDVRDAINQCAKSTGDLAQCARNIVITQVLPKDAQQAARCLANGTNPEDCAKGELATALRNLQQSAGNQADKFFQAAPSEIQNVINLVQAIQQGDVQAMLSNGGAAITKLVVKEIVNAILPPGVVAIAGPVIDKIIEDRVDLANRLIQAAKSGDVAQASEVVVEGYLIIEAEVPCALIGEIPGLPDLKEAICGTVAKIIGAVGQSVDDAVHYLENLAKDPANILNVPGDLLDEGGKIVQDFQEWWLGKDTNCSSFAEYYGRRYTVCFGAAESKNITNPGATATYISQLHDQCTGYFNQCYLSGKSTRACDAMTTTFTQQLQQLDQGVRATAATYSRELRHYVETRGGCGEHPAWEMCATQVAACDPDFLDWGYDEFIGQCGASVGKLIPVAGMDDTINGENSDNGPLTTNCVPSQPRFASDSVTNQACRAVVSLDEFKKEAARVCRQNSIATDSHRIQILKNAFGAGDPIPSLGLTPNVPVRVDLAPRIFQGGDRGDPIPSISQPTYGPLRHVTPLLPSTEPSSNTPLLRNGPSPAQIFRSGGGAATGGSGDCPPYTIADGHGGCSGSDGSYTPKNNVPAGPASGGATAGTPSNAGGSGCPPYTIPDGHGGCSGSDTVQRGGISYDRSGKPIIPSGGAASTSGSGCPPYTIPDGRGGCSGSDTVQRGGISYDRSGKPIIPSGAAASTSGSGCPPYTIPDGHGGCSGSDTVQRGGTSYDRSGKPIIPSAGAASASRSSGCPQYMTPDGHGGCSGADTVQRGGTSVPRASASGGVSSTTTGVRRIDTNARTDILRSGGANAARPFSTPTTPSVSNNSVVLRRGSGAANAIRNQQFTPGLH